MPDEENQDQGAPEAAEAAESAVYDEPEVEHHDPQAELAQALQPTEEHFASFAPEPDPPDIEVPEGESAAPPAVLAFDERMKLPFEGLLYVGALTHSFTWAGHRFTIKTLTTDEICEVGLVHQPYVGTLAEMKAYQAAATAACIVSIDGRPLPFPITDDVGDTLLAVRFEYVRRHWAPAVIDVIYSQYLVLEQKVNEVLIAMGKASG